MKTMRERLESTTIEMLREVGTLMPRTMMLNPIDYGTLVDELLRLDRGFFNTDDIDSTDMSAISPMRMMLAGWLAGSVMCRLSL